MNDGPAIEKSLRDFNLFWLSRTLSSVGSAFTKVAFPLLVLRTTGDIQKMAFATACLTTGCVVAGLVAGPVVDRADRRRLVMTCDALLALLLASIPLTAWLAGPVPLPLLYAVAFFEGLLDAACGLACSALIPALVPKDRITQANGWLQASEAISYLVGAALAGLMVQRWGAESAIGVDVLSFVVSLVTMLALRGAYPAVVHSTADRLEGLRFIARTPVLRTLAVLLGIQAFLTAAVFDLFTFHVKDTLGGDDATVGLVFAVASVGAIGGALLAPLARRRIGMHATFVLTGALLAVLMGLASVVQTVPSAAGLAVGLTFAMTLRAVLSMSRRQEITPAALIGRVTAVFWLMVTASQAVGAAAVGSLATRVGATVTFKATAVALAILAVHTVMATALRESPDHRPST
ncbi:MAG: MFS transporter [Minicystis sp.]